MNWERSAFGVKVRSTLIFERTLELTSQLCWKPEDLGLTRVHLLDGKVYQTKKALNSLGVEKPNAMELFDWLDPLKAMSGVARESYLREGHWSKREQIVNILVDTAAQAYLEETRQVLGRLTGECFDNAEFVKIDANNTARKFVGAADTVFIDHLNKVIALIEIKIGNSGTKYSLGQSIKYGALEALLKTERFFPKYKVCKLLIAPQPDFASSTIKPVELGPSQNTEGQIDFSYSPEGLANLVPYGRVDADSLISARLHSLMKEEQTCLQPVTKSVYFYSWPTIRDLAPQGDLKSNLEALMQYLSPDYKVQDE